MKTSHILSVIFSFAFITLAMAQCPVQEEYLSWTKIDETTFENPDDPAQYCFIQNNNLVYAITYARSAKGLYDAVNAWEKEFKDVSLSSNEAFMPSYITQWDFNHVYNACTLGSGVLTVVDQSYSMNVKAILSCTDEITAIYYVYDL